MTFVIIVYHNEDEVKNFIYHQLFAQTYTGIKVYVVVNGGSFTFEKDERVTVLHPGANTGYLGALRYVIETQRPAFDYITLCNTDLRFPNTNFLQQYINAITGKTFAVAGPGIFSVLTQTAQNPLYQSRLSVQKLKRIQFFYSHPFLYRFYQWMFYVRKSVTKHSAPLINSNPYALQGSFITISKNYFERGGTLNYPVLLYGEELFLAEEALRIGLINIIVPNLTITHYEHVTTGRYNVKQVASMEASVTFILENYYGK